MKSSIYVKRQSFEVRKFSVISLVLIAFCQPLLLRNSVRDVTDIFAIVTIDAVNCSLHLSLRDWTAIERNNKIRFNCEVQINYI